MPNVLATARYILKKAGKMDRKRLQQLLYYSQGWSLAIEGEELFPEEFEAWVHGPVCRELFNFTESKNIGWGDMSYRIIPKKCCDGELTEDQRDLIDEVLEVYGKYSMYDLEYAIHREDPYKKARVGVNPWEFCENVISKEDMSIFFKSMQEEEEDLPVGAEITD